MSLFSYETMTFV